MPGYEVIGVPGGSSGWVNTDALHCRTKGIADKNMLWVRHMPYFDTIAHLDEFEIEATIMPLSGEALYPDSLLVYYQVGNDDWLSVSMTTEDDTTFVGLIPGQEPGSDISYYIHAADESGRSVNHPIPAAYDPHEFSIRMDVNPDITVMPNSITFLTFEEMLNGIPVMVYNPTDQNVVINQLTNVGAIFKWYIDPWGIILPYELTSGDSLELIVKADIPVAWPGEIITDTMYIQTDPGTHRVLINIDSDLLYDINENSTLTDVQSFPNPFSDQTNIHFTTKQPGKVQIDIYNQNGQKIRSLMDQELGMGQHKVQWDATTEYGAIAPGGIYFYMLHLNNALIVKKILLIK